MESSGLINISWESGWKTLRPGTGKFISLLQMAKSSEPAISACNIRQLMTYPHLHHLFVVNALPKSNQLTFWNLDLPQTLFSIRLHYPYEPQAHQHKQWEIRQSALVHSLPGQHGLAKTVAGPNSCPWCYRLLIWWHIPKSSVYWLTGI